jgi:hypothetical protein
MIGETIERYAQKRQISFYKACLDAMDNKSICTLKIIMRLMWFENHIYPSSDGLSVFF